MMWLKQGLEQCARLVHAGVRVMEVRAAYAELDFEWDHCKRLATEGVKEANVRLMREFAAERFASSLASTGEGGDTPDTRGK